MERKQGIFKFKDWHGKEIRYPICKETFDTLGRFSTTVYKGDNFCTKGVYSKRKEVEANAFFLE